MRLGQLARKYDVPIQEMISYLQEEDPTLSGLHPNISLSSEEENLLAKEFDPNYGVVPEKAAAVVSEPEMDDKPQTKEAEFQEQIEEVVQGEAQIEEEESSPKETAEAAPDVEIEMSTAPAVEEPTAQEKQEKTIETDKLMELLESEEGSPELDQITLIKAPKRELGGLKVVGKIELPEPRVKPTEKSDSKEDKPGSKRNDRKKQREQSEEERRQRILRAKKKREEAEARKEEKRKEKELREEKERKAAHYRKKVKLKKSDPNKVRRVLPPQKVLVDIVDEQPESRSMLARFWKWLNT